MRERGLLDGQKWAYFVAAGTYYAYGPSDNQEKQISCASESETRSRHKNGAHNQHPAASDAVSSRGEIERNHRVAEQRQRKQQARLRFIESQADQVED